MAFKRYIYLDTQNVTLLGIKVFADKIKVEFSRRNQPELEYTVSPEMGDLIRHRKGNTYKQGRRPCEDGDRGKSYVCHKPKNSRSNQI